MSQITTSTESSEFFPAPDYPVTGSFEAMLRLSETEQVALIVAVTEFLALAEKTATCSPAHNSVMGTLQSVERRLRAMRLGNKNWNNRDEVTFV